ncbi:Hypothetical Protein FCC1311_085342 [Hondaea fermentalgiana]|uniref:Uncharacterized protein n=1 Tax=Hondaea fermentalgiana TaxID=2315210 RepID=A0A2R5GPS7_9STRA|nr:Hypothetical Protein FCC1311_085342 [Hondaea fermentalgiana]|eukprot:GBG32309.1 Hypothetical Protein FCC1311_085342 [Hondaea fermentalgiana]
MALKSASKETDEAPLRPSADEPKHGFERGSEPSTGISTGLRCKPHVVWLSQRRASCSSMSAMTEEGLEMWTHESSEGFPETAQARDGAMEMVSCEYHNQWVVFVSEVGRIGTVVEARKDHPRDQTKGGYSVEVKLGDREDMWAEMPPKPQRCHRRQAKSK